MTMNEKLRRFAETHKMSAIAARAGVKAATLNSYVYHQKRPIPSHVALSLARALSVSAEWLIDEARDWPPVWENTDSGATSAA